MGQRLPPILLTALAQQINVAQLLAASGAIGNIKINDIVLGSAHIGRVTLDGTLLHLDSGSALLGNVRTVMELKFSLHWWYDVWFDSAEGDQDLGSLLFPVTIGTVTVPSLNNIPLAIPNFTATNVTAGIAPISNLDLGGAVFTGVEAGNATIPADSFQLSGIGVASAEIDHLQVPRTLVEKATVQDFKPNANIAVPKVQLGPIQLPTATAADIQTTAEIGFRADASTRSLLPLDFGFFGFTLTATPTAHVSIGSLRLQGVSLGGSVNQAAIENVSVPVDIRGINLTTIDIRQIDVNDLKL